MRLLKRKTKKSDAHAKIELERVIGLTTTTASGLACNAATGEIAYLAGCVVVIYNAKTNTQTRFLVTDHAPKPLSCVAYSYQSGKFIAAGESGHQPAVVVWDSFTGTSMIELKTHKIGISCIEFSPSGKYIVSVGVPHDGFLCLWEWRSGTLLAKSRSTTVSSPISAIRFASDGSFFLTAGIKHLRQWSIGQGQGLRVRPQSTGNFSLEGRSVNLGSQKDGSFVSISSSMSKDCKSHGGQSSEIQPIYVLTNAGVLCLLHFGIAVEKWVDLKVRHGYDVAVSETHVACACSEGIVRVFLLGNLAYVSTLPRPAPYGYHGLTDESVCVTLSSGRVHGVNFPDAVACRFLVGGERMAVIYSDHSFYVWDVRDLSKISRHRTILSHSSCIWDVITIPQPLKSKSDLEVFATCSADGSIRIWNLGPDKEPFLSVQRTPNVYCKEISGVIYIDPKVMLGNQNSTVEAEGGLDVSLGYRAISVSMDGKLLAAGDRCGNLRVYDLADLNLVTYQEAHDAEILSLSFGALPVSSTESQKSLLASGGRDRLVHIYDVARNFDVVETLDDHSASITRVKFSCGGSKLLSCSADKSVVFRQVEATDSGTKSTRYHQEVAPRGTIYDMDVHPNDKVVVTVGQDKKLNILNLASGKPVRCVKSEADVGEPIKVRVDPSGTFMISSHSDKYMRLYDFASGEMLNHVSGHAEVITGMTWLHDCRRLISVSGDSCIFIWKLPPVMSRTMRRKLVSQTETYGGRFPGRSNKAQIAVKDTSDPKADVECPAHAENMVAEPDTPAAQTSHELPAFKFSVSRLPSWAKSKVVEANSESTRMTPSDNSEMDDHHSSESRWVERVGNDGYKLATELDEETPPAIIHPSGFGTRRRFSVEPLAESRTRDSTPEGSSQTDGSPMSSPREPPRRETQWTTVHTVFFDELDFPNEQGDNYDVSFSTSRRSMKMQEVEVSRNNGAAYQIATSCSASSTPKKEDAFAVSSKYKQLEFEEWKPGVSSDTDRQESGPVKEGYSNTSGGDESDDDSSPHRDLFSAHFGKLSSNVKVNSSTRSSLSARYFARSGFPSSIVKDSKLKPENEEEDNDDDDDDNVLLDDNELVHQTSGGLLAAERERLKLQERQEMIRVHEVLNVEEVTAINQCAEPVQTNSIPQRQIEKDKCSDVSESNNTPQEIPAQTLTLSAESFPRPHDEYVAALEDLAEAAERALTLFCELSEEKSSKLTQSFQRVVPAALDKIQRLAQHISPATVTATAPPAAPTVSTSSSSSVDIEALLENYSLRFSQSLAQQVLALVQKKLDTP